MSGHSAQGGAGAAGGDLVLEELPVAEAPAWDRFVEGHPLGQIQQCSCWAEAKRSEGWKSLRVVARRGGDIVAGAQILWKNTRFGTLGFLNKGPLWSAAAGVDGATVVRALHGLQSRLRLRALVAQGPDDLRSMDEDFLAAGWMRERLLGVIESTLLVDLRPGWEEVKKKFRRAVRRQARVGQEAGLTIEEGGEADVAQFFELMCKTCEAQGTRPNPATSEAMRALWQATAKEGRARMHFVRHEGRRIAGGFSLNFNGRVTFWKKGWDQDRTDLYPSTLLTWDIIQWGVEHGCQWLDFVSLDRDLAECLEAGKELPEDVTKRRDFFNLGFSDCGRALPRVYIRFAQPVLGWGYRLATTDLLRPKARQMMRKLSVG